MEITFIGCGEMASAMAEGLKNNHLSFYDIHFEKSRHLATKLNGNALSTPLEGSSDKTIFILAVKPQDIESVSLLLKDLKRGKLLISVLTGISSSTLQERFTKIPTLRAMPNLAVRLGQGCIALANTPELESKKNFINELLAPLGTTLWLDEKLLNSATALIGSGPAFVTLILEAMVESGIAMGFKSDDAYLFAKQMIRGTLALLDSSGESPSKLRWKVASPGGTTIAGLRTLEEKNVRSGIIEGFISAYTRAKELGN